VDTPGYSKTHSYGQPFGTSPETGDDEAWAGPGYDQVPPPEALEPVDNAA
jgi:hypothetical protein